MKPVFKHKLSVADLPDDNFSVEQHFFTVKDIEMGAVQFDQNYDFSDEEFDEDDDLDETLSAISSMDGQYEQDKFDEFYEKDNQNVNQEESEVDDAE